jgi:peptide-methionine (S)-S-oxide reductase
MNRNIRWWPIRLSVALAAGIGAIASQNSLGAMEGPAFAIAPPALDNPKTAGSLQTAILSGGCFWGVQAVFEHVQGVHGVLSGYAGGERSTADYETVSSGKTNHAESVQITFDPAEVSYGELLQVFFSVVHDPTQLNRQGPDAGTQYRSEIFYSDESQEKIARAYIAQLDATKVFSGAIETRIDPLKGFYRAEQYHQDYLLRNPTNPYIVYNDLPKIENLRRLFPNYYRGQPLTVGYIDSRGRQQ